MVVLMTRVHVFDYLSGKASTSMLCGLPAVKVSSWNCVMRPRPTNIMPVFSHSSWISSDSKLPHSNLTCGQGRVVRVYMM